jgi:competence protein ComEC
VEYPTRSVGRLDFVPDVLADDCAAVSFRILGFGLGFVSIYSGVRSKSRTVRVVFADSRIGLGSAFGALADVAKRGQMATRLFVFFLILSFALPLSVEVRPYLVVWNVGQGQWATVVDEDGCWHFDVGGEFAPWSSIMSMCRARRNFISLSHWDWDHVGLIGRATRFLPNICLLFAPPDVDKEVSRRKRNLLRGLENCPPRFAFSYWVGDRSKTTNASSRVILSRGVLLPGDSPIDQEKKWIRYFRDLDRVRVLILGHHGSRTSTGKDLLRALSGVQLAISSSRFRRYGHPHVKVIDALRARAVPLLRTEDWGSIQIEL